MPSTVLSPQAGKLPEITDKQKETLKKCRRIKLFDTMSDQELLSILAFFHESKYDKEAVIFYERDIPKEAGAKVYFVLSGCVKLVKYSSDGESTIVRLASIGDFFGATGALTNKPYPFSAEVLADTTVLYIDAYNFEEITRRYPQIALNMIVALGEVLWFNYETHNQVVKKTDARVAKILMYHLKRDGYKETPDGLQLSIQLPHEYIASMTGIAYEESVRIVSRLKKMHGCINYLRGGKIIITNLDKLKEINQVDDDWSI